MKVKSPHGLQSSDLELLLNGLQPSYLELLLNIPINENGEYDRVGKILFLFLNTFHNTLSKETIL